MSCKKRKKEVISENNNMFSFNYIKIVIIKNGKERLN